MIRTVTRVIKGKTDIEDYIEAKPVSETERGAASSELATGSSAEYDPEVTEVQRSEKLRRLSAESASQPVAVMTRGMAAKAISEVGNSLNAANAQTQWSDAHMVISTLPK